MNMAFVQETAFESLEKKDTPGPPPKLYYYCRGATCVHASCLHSLRGCPFTYVAIGASSGLHTLLLSI